MLFSALAGRSLLAVDNWRDKREFKEYLGSIFFEGNQDACFSMDRGELDSAVDTFLKTATREDAKELRGKCEELQSNLTRLFYCSLTTTDLSELNDIKTAINENLKYINDKLEAVVKWSDKFQELLNKIGNE